MRMDFKKFHKQTAEQTNKQLKKILKKWRKEAGSINGSLLPLVDKFIDSCEGGKRIRGVLVVLGYEIGKQSSVVSRQSSDKTSLKAESEAVLKTESSIIKVAAGYEIFHSAILAHDDVIDQSLLRRGKPSLFQALGGDHYGKSQAVCLGDAGFFLAEKVISETNFPDLEKMKALQWFFQTMLDTALGQMLDIKGVDAITTAKLKTAEYSITGPLILGAILGGRHHLEGVKARLPGELDSLVKFGENLGIAFQIQDDILDSEANSWGGVDCAKKEAEKYKNQALKVLPNITKDRKMSKILEQMAEYLVERTK